MRFTKSTRMLVVGASILALLTSAGGANLTAQAADSNLTEVGTPRNQTLIIDNIDGKVNNPKDWNGYEGADVGGPWHTLLYSPLWEINSVTGKQFPDLASGPAKLLNKNYTEWQIPIRKGIYWSDGVPFTAKDLVFTYNMLIKHKAKMASAIPGLVKSVKLVNDYTVDITTNSPAPNLMYNLGSTVWDAWGAWIMPEHIWSKVDPTKYMNYPNPVGVGPYTLTKVDPQGNWFLFTRRKDWQRSDVGVITHKMPAPKYVLMRYYGPSSQKIIAAMQHKLDVMCDITPDDWNVLHRRDPYAHAWFNTFPYANLSDPGARAMTFNDSKYPYNMWQVRWALALAINLPQTSMTAYNGVLRAGVLIAAPTDVMESTWYTKLQPWLEKFKLPDGFQPYDPHYADEVSALMKKAGDTGLPTNETQLMKEFGYGWWKYAPDEAAKLLESVGFKKDSNGNWLLPNGKPWTMTVNAPSGFEAQSVGYAYAISSQWKTFGINTTVQPLIQSTFGGNYASGKYDTGPYWPLLTAIPKFYTVLMPFTKENNWGKPATGWVDKANGKLIEEINKLPVTDPRTNGLMEKILENGVKDMPWIPLYSSTKMVPTEDYYWTNFPSADNEYEGPWWWWSSFKFMLTHIKPTGRS